jgi:hypothetical protein
VPVWVRTAEKMSLSTALICRSAVGAGRKQIRYCLQLLRQAQTIPRNRCYYHCHCWYSQLG